VPSLLKSLMHETFLWKRRQGGRKVCFEQHTYLKVLLAVLPGFVLACGRPAPLATAPVAATPAPQATPARSPLSPALEEGRNLFISKGCVNCHGPNLEYLAPVNIKEMNEPEVIRWVRSPQGMMPVFPPGQVTDEELQKIARFVVDGLSRRGK